MRRSAEEIKARCKFVLNDKQVVYLVKESSSPSAAYEMVFAETNDVEKAKAGRWLAVLRRDYPEVFDELLK
jgi:hypothetical protein